MNKKLILILGKPSKKHLPIWNPKYPFEEEIAIVEGKEPTPNPSLKGGEIKGGEIKAGEIKAGEIKAGEIKAGEMKARENG